MRNPVRVAQKRQFFDTIKQKYTNEVICESHLVIEAPITVAAGAISFLTFDITENSSTRPYEKRLSRNDAFYVTEIGLGIAAGKAAGTATTGAEIIDFFPNGDHVGTAANAAKLEAIYRGFLSIQKESLSVLEGFFTGDFKFVDAVTDPTSPVALKQQGISMEDAMYDLVGPLPLEGDIKTNIRIDFPQLSAALGTTTENVILILRGFLVKGGRRGLNN